jgi:hypothetical protein
VTMDVLHGNHRALTMIADHWPAAGTHRASDCAIIRVQLPPGQHDQPRAWPAALGTRHSAPPAIAGRA